MAIKVPVENDLHSADAWAFFGSGNDLAFEPDGRFVVVAIHLEDDGRIWPDPLQSVHP